MKYKVGDEVCYINDGYGDGLLTGTIQKIQYAIITLESGYEDDAYRFIPSPIAKIKEAREYVKCNRDSSDYNGVPTYTKWDINNSMLSVYDEVLKLLEGE